MSSSCANISRWFTGVNCYYGWIVAKLWPQSGRQEGLMASAAGFHHADGRAGSRPPCDGLRILESSRGALVEFEQALAQAGGHLLDPLLFGAGQGQGAAEFDHVGVGQRIDVDPR
jgi:hypothetical protein